MAYLVGKSWHSKAVKMATLPECFHVAVKQPTLFNDHAKAKGAGQCHATARRTRQPKAGADRAAVDTARHVMLLLGASTEDARPLITGLQILVPGACVKLLPHAIQL